MIVPGGRTVASIWIYLLVLAITLSLGFLLYEAATRPARPTPQKTPPMHDPK
jgi:hypothetical protein